MTVSAGDRRPVIRARKPTSLINAPRTSRARTYNYSLRWFTDNLLFARRQPGPGRLSSTHRKTVHHG